MKQLFPQFEYHRTKRSWIGHLQPSDKSPNYLIRIYFRVGYHPRVTILDPPISEDAPHTYKSSGSLCLYYPKDNSWSSKKLIAKTIVPWTAEWLRYYEIWLVTNRWFGPEAPHRANK